VTGPHLGLIASLETSSREISLALLPAGAGTPIEEVLPGSRESGRLLLPALATLLERSGAALSEVALLGVGVGPGSYTGVRLGLALAKGLARGGGVPLCGVGSLEVLAHGEPATAPLLATSNAYRGEIFHALFDRGDDGELACIRAPTCGPPAQAVAGLPPGCVAVGDGAEAYAEVLESHGVAVRMARRPRAGVIARLVRTGVVPLIDPGAVRPVHLRPASQEYRTLRERQEGGR
jgi:tRNA threonylcarbamoyladenosine biosynthesis protein TsaB